MTACTNLLNGLRMRCGSVSLKLCAPTARFTGSSIESFPIPGLAAEHEGVIYLFFRFLDAVGEPRDHVIFVVGADDLLDQFEPRLAFRASPGIKVDGLYRL